MQRFAVTEKIISVSFLVYVRACNLAKQVTLVSRTNAAMLVLLSETHPIALPLLLP